MEEDTFNSFGDDTTSAVQAPSAAGKTPLTRDDRQLVYRSVALYLSVGLSLEQAMERMRAGLEKSLLNDDPSIARISTAAGALRALIATARTDEATEVFVADLFARSNFVLTPVELCVFMLTLKETEDSPESLCRSFEVAAQALQAQGRR